MQPDSPLQRCPDCGSLWTRKRGDCGLWECRYCASLFGVAPEEEHA